MTHQQRIRYTMEELYALRHVHLSEPPNKNPSYARAMDVGFGPQHDARARDTAQRWVEFFDVYGDCLLK